MFFNLTYILKEQCDKKTTSTAVQTAIEVAFCYGLLIVKLSPNAPIAKIRSITKGAV